jgi:glycine/D-amino acid oxidase-like deaminating enzyme
MNHFPYITSYWNQNNVGDSKIQFQPSIEKNLTCDIAVIGGGYAGLSTALELKNKFPNLNICIFEGKYLGFGASSRNGGWLVPFPPLFWLADNLKNTERQSDYSFAVQYTKNNIEKLKLQIAEMISEDDWKETEHQLIARNRLEKATIKWLKYRLNLLGFNCEYFDYDSSQPHVNYNYQAGISWPTAVVNPYKIIQVFRNYCLEKKVNFYENTSISEIQLTNKNITLKTNMNFQIEAEKVILCTNAYSAKLNVDYDSPGASVQHTYMIATEKLDKKLQETISTSDRPFGDPSFYYYCGRFHKDHLLFNGFDRKSNATDEDDRYDPAYNDIYTEMIKRFPQLRDKKIESAWAGPVLQTRTDSPIVKFSKINPNLIFNIGYGGGSGISMALQSGRLVRGLLDPTDPENQKAVRMLKILSSTEFPILGSAQVVANILRLMFFK